MIDNIKNQSTNPGRLKPNSDGGVKGSAKAGANDAGQAVDNRGTEAGGDVQLSEQAKQLDAVSRQIAASPDVDTQKVQALKTAIESGEYQINYDNLAQRIVDSFAGEDV